MLAYKPRQMMDVGLFGYIFYLICIWSIRGIRGNQQSDGMLDYCWGDTFEPTCGDNEVIMIIAAEYGRPERSHCIDEGSVGCKVGIQAMLDELCSGRRTCDFLLPNPAMIALRPCGRSSHYLRAAYRCIPVLTIHQQQCSAGDILQITSPTSGYIGSVTTRESGCGSESSPWLIEAPEGQRILLTLLDFMDTSNQQHMNPNSVCLMYANVKEPSSNQMTTVCGGQGRERLVYTSKTNVIQVEMINRGMERYFLLQYKFDGCSNMSPGPNFRSNREGNVTLIECSTGETKATFHCDGSSWQGNMPNCSGSTQPPPRQPDIAPNKIIEATPSSTIPTHHVVKPNNGRKSSLKKSLNFKSITWGMVLILVGILTLGMVACVLIISVVYLKRKSHELKSPILVPALPSDPGYEVCDFEISKRTSTVYRDGFRTVPKNYTPIMPGGRLEYDAQTWERPLPPEPLVMPHDV